MIATIKKKVYQTSVWHKYFKNRTEMDHWMSTVNRITKWYLGEREYLFPFPSEEKREKRFTLRKNAILTYIRVETEDASYLRDLKLRPDSFAGLKVADVGSGPLPTLLVFKDCERYCIDHLMDAYRALGYPIDEFESTTRFINAKSEDIPLNDGYFDAVISRNALDHVDNFENTAEEIKRVLKPSGYLHILVNYHPPTSSEPLTLSDERILYNFEDLNIRKLHETNDAWGFKGGKTVLWSNMPDSLLASHDQPNPGG